MLYPGYGCDEKDTMSARHNKQIYRILTWAGWNKTSDDERRIAAQLR